MSSYPNPAKSSDITGAYSPDTINFNQRRKWTCGTHNNWRIVKSQEIGDPRVPVTVNAYHRYFKELHLRGDETGPKTVILSSLPKLLYGHNGRIIRSDEDQMFAYELLERVLSEVSEPLGVIEKYTRFDVSFHCDINYLDIQELLRHAKPTNGRKAASIKEGESIRFDCGDAQVEFYDKLREMQRHKFDVCGRPVTRCEVRCRTAEAVHKYFGQDLLEFGPCQKTLKDGVFKLLSKWFPPHREVARPNNIYQFLAEEEGVSPG